MTEHYQRPGWVTTNVVNRIGAGLTHRAFRISIT
jgi:hypothetical protein